MSPDPLLPSARRASRLIAAAAVVLGLAGARGGSRRAQQALTLGVLALGMPHGAADTELLRLLGRGDRRRHGELLGAYAATAVAATAVVRRPGPWVELLTLAASAAHFAEGELACWGPPVPGAGPGRTVLRACLAATTSALLPASVSRAGRGDLRVGASGAVTGGPVRSGGERSGMALLRGGGHSSRPVSVVLLTGFCAVGAGVLALDGDRRAAADTALLATLAVVATPSLAFAAYFGGWHSLRHTARVADALTAAGALAPQPGLPAAVVVLARRSAWAAAVGILGAGALAALEPQRLTDNAFAAVLGLTVPHMATVTAALARRGR